MVNLISYVDGHKVARHISSKEEYFEIRNSQWNKDNFQKARAGDDNAKRKLLQFNYNDQLPDGVLKDCHTASSTFAHDIDCRSQQECQDIAKKLLNMKEQLGLLELTVSPNWGLHAVCQREPGKTILENQIRIALLTETEMDCNAHDAARIMFTGPADEATLLYLDDRLFEEPLSVEEGQQEHLRLKEREEKGKEELPANYKKGEKHYRPSEQPAPAPSTPTTETPAQTEAKQAKVFGYDPLDFINTIYPNGAPVGQRHPTMLKLACDLIILLDNDKPSVKQVLLRLPWVQAVVNERGAKELDDVIDSAQKLLKKRETENLYTPTPSRLMQQAINSVTHQKYKTLVLKAQQGDHHPPGSADEATNMLEDMGRQLKELTPHYPLLKLLCYGRKQKHHIPALFVGGAFAMTLMTRCWYRFWPSGNKKCRLNSHVELIGRMGSGKHMAVDIYRLMMEPIKKADKSQIDALNKWNAEKEQNGGGTKNKQQRPKDMLRCLPPETSVAAIREAEFNAKEIIDGEEWPLHVSIFDSEFDNTLRQLKKGYMDAFQTLWLKAMSNEPHGSYLKTSSAPVGEYDVHFNCVYTGTMEAFRKIATPENVANGLTSRSATIPMGDTNFEMMEEKKSTPQDLLIEQQISDWAYKLDATKGEIPCEAISSALREWTQRRMEEAKEAGSKALEDLLKRPCWHAINFALPFIVSRHWDQMVQDNGRMKCAPYFKTDRYDRKLAIFICNVQYAFQRYFYQETAEKNYEDHLLLEMSNTRHQPKSLQAYHRLTEVFTQEDVMREFGYDNMNSVNSRIKRLRDDGLIQKIGCGPNKGKYRKLSMTA